jgi:hypothetical protein
VSPTGGDLGDPISYLVLEEGTPVLSSDGAQLGHVAHVLADEQDDIFDGIVIAHGAGRPETFADAYQVASIHQRGVTLTVPASEAAELPRPSPNPAAMRVDPADTGRSSLEDKLRRAWDRLSGRS